ncbi:helix-turn-helix domain-containing protein [Streptomyces sp. NPDC008121]|uniref:helix-turn-helix domain-containing protein n=1 Tax=Streptomyces sp. NPDC008121 TaxID=3364809 RepID=UPI0036EBD3A5
MDTQNTSVRPRARSRNDGKNHPTGRARKAPRVGGVIHDNVRHTTRFTVVGNHLSQHAELSLVAIGLAVHIQSLPTGAQVDINTLARRFREGKARIADGLRELESHGYLRRTLERGDDGTIVTRTVSCNQPNRSAADASRPRPRRNAEDPKPRPRRNADDPKPRPPRNAEGPRPRPRRSGEEQESQLPPRRAADKPARRRALPAVPQPAYPAPDLLQTALGVLSGLRRQDPRLLLSATDAEHLVPGVAAWLERDLTPEAVGHALTAGLPPEPLYRPAALLAHRLVAKLPPLPPFATPTPSPRHPLQNCDLCDRAFRAPQPGTCAACTPPERPQPLMPPGEPRRNG